MYITDKSTSSSLATVLLVGERLYIYYSVVVGVEGAGRGGRGIYIRDKYE